ncbi:MAG: MG2 domain-containing protein [Candidatus Absconditabacteria bacterium]|nr:MG2 domain-containing protein [Candidatus Absconditabacteria bacterium]
MKKHSKILAKKWLWIAGIVLVLGLSVGGFFYLQNNSVQIFSDQDYATGSAKITKISPQGKIDNLYQTLTIFYSKPMVPLALLSKKDTFPCPIDIIPQTEGTCKRISSRVVEFTPKTHWQGSTKYQATSKNIPGLFNQIENIETIEFSTPELSISFPNYIDPRSGLNIVANFPVSLDELYSKLKLFHNNKQQQIKIQSTNKDLTNFNISLVNSDFYYNQNYTIEIEEGLTSIYGNIPANKIGKVIYTNKFVESINVYQQYKNQNGDQITKGERDRRNDYGNDDGAILQIPSKDIEFHIYFSENVPLSKNLIKLSNQNGISPKYSLSYLYNEDKTENKKGVKIVVGENLDLGSEYVVEVSKSANKYMQIDELKRFSTAPSLKVTRLLPKSYNISCLYTNNKLEDRDYQGNWGTIKNYISIEPKAQISSIDQLGSWNQTDCPAPNKGEVGYILHTRLNPFSTYSIQTTSNLTDVFGNKISNSIKETITTKDIQQQDKYLYSSLNRETNVIPSNLKIVSNIKTINLNEIDLEVCQMTVDQYIVFLESSYKRTIGQDFCSEYRQGKYKVKNNHRFLTPNKIDIESDIFNKEIEYPVVVVKAKIPGAKNGQEYDNYDKDMIQVYLRQNASIVMERAKDKTLFFATTIDGKEILKDMGFILYSRDGYGYGNTTKYTEIAKQPIYNSKKQVYEINYEGTIDFVLARDRNHLAIIRSEDNADNYDFNYVGGYSSYDKSFLYFYTDRPIYKPGDKVYYKGLGRNFTPTGYDRLKQKITINMIDQNTWESVKTLTVTPDKNGNINGEFVLPKDMKLGMYHFQSDGIVVVNMPIDVQEYKKPLFKTDVAIEKSDYQMGETIKAEIGASYYFGGKITSAKGNYTIQRQNYFFDAKDYSDYQFGKGYEYFSCLYRGECRNGDQWIKNEEFSIDGQGKGTIQYTTPKTDTGNEYIYTFNVNIVDPQTSNLVNKSSSVVLHQTDGYVGIKLPYRTSLEKGIDFRGVVLDRNANPKKDSKVEIKIIKRDRQAVKKQSVNGIFFTDYELKETEVDSFTLTSDNGGEIQKNIQLKKGGQYLVEARYIGSDKRNFISNQEVYVDNNEYMVRNNDNNSVTSLMAESVKLNIGETQTFTVQSPVNQGKIFVSIEKDDGILDYRVQEIDSYSPKIIVPIKESYYPNIYTKVFLLGQSRLPDGQGSGDLPVYKRALGITKVDTNYKKVNIQIDTDKKLYKPGEKISITAKITDENQKPIANANASIAVVDQSVLALKGNPQKNPYAFFFDMKRYLGVNTYLSLWNLIEKLEIKDPTDGSKGGDGELTKGGNSKKKRGIFKDTAFWTANLISDKNGIIQVVTDALPDNLTTWNIEILANTSPETKIGVSQTTIMTNKDLMIQENLPQVFGAGDTIVLKPLVINKTGKPAKIEVSLKATFTKIQKPIQTIELQDGESKTLDFEITVDELNDLNKQISQIEISAKDSLSSAQDAVQKYVQIVPTSTLETVTTIGKGSDKPEKETINLDGIANYPGKLNITYSPSLMGNILQSVSFLSDYPYGCLEQKSSKIIPIALLKKLHNKLNESYDLKKIKTQRREGSDEGMAEVSLDQVIQEFITELPSFQNRDGGMVYRADSKDKSPSNMRVTSYLLSTIGYLQEIGYQIPAKVISDMRSYLQTERYHNKMPNCQTFCEYDLGTRIMVIDALANQSKNEYLPYKMRTLLKETKTKELDQRKDLLLSQALMLAKLSQNTNLSKKEQDGVLEDAKKILQKVQNNDLVVNPRDAYIGKEAYTNRIKQTSQMIEAIFMLDKSYATQQEQTTEMMIKWLAGQKKRGGFGSTTDTILVMKAMISYLEFSPIPQKTRIAKLVLDDKVVHQDTLKAKDKFTIYSKTFDFSELSKKNTFALQVETGSVYYDLTLSYYLPSQEILERDEGFAIKRTYYDYQEYLKIQTLKSQEQEEYRKGKISYTDLKYPKNITSYLVPVKQAKVGQLLIVDNQIISSETRDQVVFEGFLPAGVDAVNTSLATSQKLNLQNDSSKSNGYGYGYDNYYGEKYFDYVVEEKNPLAENGLTQINTDGNLFERVEFRVDRVMAYSEKLEPGIHNFIYAIRAGYSGQFGINPTMISQMYSPEVFGRTAGQIFKIY